MRSGIASSHMLTDDSPNTATVMVALSAFGFRQVWWRLRVFAKGLLKIFGDPLCSGRQVWLSTVVLGYNRCCEVATCGRHRID
jgi:hypothetical protein